MFCSCQLLFRSSSASRQFIKRSDLERRVQHHFGDIQSRIDRLLAASALIPSDASKTMRVAFFCISSRTCASAAVIISAATPAWIESIVVAIFCNSIERSGYIPDSFLNVKPQTAIEDIAMCLTTAAIQEVTVAPDSIMPITENTTEHGYYCTYLNGVRSAQNDHQIRLVLLCQS
jgi:hypothetical protein